MAERPDLAEIQARMTSLSRQLGLVDLPQDWGISNASSERLEEFMTFYSVKTLGDVERGAVAELLLASADERLRLDPGSDLSKFAALLPAIANDAAWEFDYWQGLDGDHFPLAAWLRAGGRSAR